MELEIRPINIKLGPTCFYYLNTLFVICLSVINSFLDDLCFNGINDNPIHWRNIFNYQLQRLWAKFLELLYKRTHGMVFMEGFSWNWALTNILSLYI